MIPANTTFVPGSLSINSIAKTDVGADDTADFNATTANGVTFFVGTGANATTGGTLIPATSGSVSFSVKVN